MIRRLLHIQLLLFALLVAALPFAAMAESVTAIHVTPGTQVKIDLKADHFPTGSGEARLVKMPVRGFAVVDGSSVIYNPLALRDGSDRLEVQLGDNADHVLRVELVVGEPDVLSGEIYERLGEQLFRLLIVAIFLEIALTTVFRNRWFRQFDAVAGIKTAVSIGAALLVVVSFELNIFGEVVAALQGKEILGTFNKPISYAITTLIVAGGSGTVYSLYERLGIRPRSASGRSGAGLDGEGRLIVNLTRVNAGQDQPVQVTLNDELVGIVQPNDTKLGGNTGLQVTSGAYRLRLTANDPSGAPVEAERAIGIEPAKPTVIDIKI